MKTEAVLLTDPGVSSKDANFPKLLRFFGVPWRTLTTAEFLAGDGTSNGAAEKCGLLCSSDTFLRLIEELDRSSEGIRLWQERVHSAFIYAGGGAEVLQKLVRRLTGDDRPVTNDTSVCAEDLVVVVSDQLNDFCGVMSGLRVAPSKASVETSLVLNTPKGSATNIISVDGGATFARLEYKGAPVFLSTCSEIIDIEAELTSRNFDVRDHFLSAGPAVLYIKWAFAEICWKAPEANACLVIDDPLLKPSYGCVNFEELGALMERHHFSTNIAFIPWNWRRSNSKVVSLFKRRPEQYSLSIHGCDHTAGEFGSRDRAGLCWKARKAVDRMSDHETRTGIHHDRIMVFPQGIFSEAAMDVLKRSNFTAAVNTEVVSVDPQPQVIRISDAWDIAVLRYGGFPIFTRRYPWQGIENFAFDILLGKPCIVVIHHDFCCDHYKRLVEFIERLNALKCPLAWRSLGEVVRRSCRQREISSGVVEIEMYGAELRIENRSAQRKRFVIRRREPDAAGIKEIRVGSREIAWHSVEGCIGFEIELNPGEIRTIEVRFHDLKGNGRSDENLPYRAKTMARRYLSELRDNYIVKNKLRFSAISG
jgi:hypothetical protein